MIYFDNSATSRFKPCSVKISTLLSLSFSANPGRSGHKESLRYAKTVEKTRALIRKTYYDGNVIFTKNCTEALNLAIFGSNLTQQVITTVYEHNSVLRPLHYLASKNKITLKILSPSDGDIHSQLIEGLKRPTSMVVLTAMSNVNGYCLDVPKLCKTVKSMSKALTLVDMAQGAGHLKINFDNVDMITVSAHKGLHASQGIGFLLAKYNCALEPLIMGGTGTSSLELKHPKELPEALEAGTLNTVGIVGLYYGLRYTYNNFDRINARIGRLQNILIPKLKSNKALNIIGYGHGIILFNCKGFTPTDFADKLNDNGVCVRSGLHCAPLMHKYLGTGEEGAVRLSLGFNNNIFDVYKFIRIIRNICHNNV